MDILTLAREFQQAADLVYTDREDHGVLLVESYSHPDFERDYLNNLRRDQLRFDFPFALFAGPSSIYLFGPDQTGEPIAEFDTKTTLRSYWMKEAESRPINQRDLVSATSQWLDDLAVDPPRDRAPHLDRLRELGLIDRLRGGFQRPMSLALQANSWGGAFD